MPTTDTEQYLLELINEARLNPLEDASRYITSFATLSSPQADIQQALAYFGINGGQLLAALQTLTPAQPLAFSDVLAAGALSHDATMIAAQQQSYQVPGENDPFTRLVDEGYNFQYAAENIYAYAQDMLYAQAGFMIDWGGSAATGGMQLPAGHRITIMNPDYREVGLGVVDTSGNGLGPEVVTEDFASLGAAGTFLLGTDFVDSAHTGFYGIGEGVAGLVVSVGGGGSTTSGSSGGWTLATNQTGLQTVQLSGGGLAGPVMVQMAFTDGQGNGLNAKLDVVDGATLRLSNSATVAGAVSAIQLLGLQALTLVEGDGLGRTLIGNDGGDLLIGGVGSDTITGGAGNDVIDGGAGSNNLDGGGGTNTVVFDFASTAATISRSGGQWVVDAPGTHDVLANFQSYQFADETVAVLAVTAPPDPLFDAAYYLAHNPDVAAAGVDPYQHYMQYGWKEGRNPSALFDTHYYLSQNPDIAAAGVNPLLHYEMFGWKEGRDPSLLFSDRGYLGANPDVAAAQVNPLLHYVEYGHGEGRAAPMTGFDGNLGAADPLVNAAYYDGQLGATLIPTGSAGQAQAAELYANTGWKLGLNPDALFSTNFYLTQYPDIRAAGIDPLAHYEANGWREGRDPSLVFGSNSYLAANPDVRAAGVDPLLHYVAYGMAEGRADPLPGYDGNQAAADPLVDAGYYERQLGITSVPAGPVAQAASAENYNASGWQRGLNPDALFDTNYYLSHNPDIAAAHIDPLLHYELYGWKEGRDPSAGFSTEKYLNAYADIRAANVDPLLHYMEFGQFEGRMAFAA